MYRDSLLSKIFLITFISFFSSNLNAMQTNTSDQEYYFPKNKRETRGIYKEYPGTPRPRKKDKGYDFKRKSKTPKNKHI